MLTCSQTDLTPNVAQHHNHKQNTDVAYYGLHDQTNQPQEPTFSNLSIDGLHTNSLGTQASTSLP